MSTNDGQLLTESQRLNAQKLLKRFFWLNGIVIPCVLENILLLWALQNGLSPAHAAVLASFLLLTMPMMFLGKRLSAAIGPVRAWSLAWFVRYLFVMAMLPAPWLRETALASLVPWLITGCVFALFSMRSMGMVNNVPIIGEVTSSQDQGSFQAQVGLRSHTAYLATLALIIGVLRWRETPGVYQVILLFGSLLGMYSAKMLKRLPPMDALRGSARIGMRSITRKIIDKPPLRRLAISWCATVTATALIVPIAMLAVKRGYHVADNTALLFTLMELVGGILAALALTVIADHTGPRPIIVLGMGLFWITAGFWAFAPRQFIPAAVGGAFFVGGMARHGIVMALNHYMLASTATRERIGVSLMMQMLSGAVSGLSGMLIAGGLIHWLTPRFPNHQGLDVYHAYYRIVLLLMLPLSVAAWRLPRLKSWTVRNVIGLVFSIRDLRALMTLNALRHDVSDDEDIERIEQLRLLASRHSEPVLRDFLRHGRLVQQARAIHALSRIPFGKAAADALIHVVENGAFTNAWLAAELLGQRRIAEAIPALRRTVRSDDPFLRGKSMVALARLTDAESYQTIREAFSQTENPRIAVHGAMALEYLHQPEDLNRILNKCIERPWSEAILDEMLLAAAGILQRKATVYRLLKNPSLTDNSGQPDGIPCSGVTPDPLEHCIACFLNSHPWEVLPMHVRVFLNQIKESS